jgi:hypothetical protein
MTPRSGWLLLIVMLLLLIVYVGESVWDLWDILIAAHLLWFKDGFYFLHHDDRELMSLCSRTV